MEQKRTDFCLKSLRINDEATIGVVSPASRPMDDEKFQQGIIYLKTLGHTVIQAPHASDRRGYLAGTDESRADDLNAMFRDPQIDAIFCSRGGYGTPRIIEKIDYEAIRQNPKIFVGYSDITTLSLAIWQQTGLITFSGPMVAVEMANQIHEFTAGNFWKMISSPTPAGLLANPNDVTLKVFHPGEARGRLLGGCLSLINVLLGTPYCPDFSGAIFFIEDIEEEPYRIDRYLAQLNMAGILDSLAGVVLGQFIDCEQKDRTKPTLELDEIFHDYFDRLKIPVIQNFAYGHGPVKFTLPVGAQAYLNTNEGGLFITESAVSDNRNA
ncbi:MAG: S66 peptidase family protein [Candidatus Zhuqueibacterota bacterium]